MGNSPYRPRKMSFSLLIWVFFPVLLLLLLFFPATLSALPPDQTSSMATLSQQIPSPPPSWNTTGEIEPCKWRGVTCNPHNSSITGLSLSGLSLSSMDNLSTICKIDSLEVLDLSDNELTSIPGQFISSCGQLAGIRRLNFSYNNLTGTMPVFSSFLQLEYLDMSYNHLNRGIGSELDGLVKLRILNLSFNSFSGPLPITLWKSTALQELVLSMNHFNGSIPQEISEYQSLALIDLGHNHLSGPVPSSIGQLQELEVLVLSGNDLSGSIPDSLLNLTKLSKFSANQNHFSGKIPPVLTRSLTSLDLSYNNLGGPIPADLLALPNLFYLDLSYNQLEGSIPGGVPSSMIRLRLGSNLLDGEIPAFAFQGLCKLIYLELDNNSLSGFIPVGLGKCQSLALLNLANNKLSGSLPSDLADLSSLQVLKLQFNSLSGEMPTIIGTLTRLSQLNMSWNNLTGSIPSSISSLGKLTTLNLQHNSLSGRIPDSIANLGSLIELQLGSNRLGGLIPTMPLQLQVALNLSYNLFQGPIPSTLSDLNNLEVLDLSNNNFNGSIPDHMTRMAALTRLVLTNNQLSGVIPKFGTEVKVEIDGNVNLIWPPTASVNSRKKRNDIALAVIISLAVVVFISMLTILLIFSASRRFYRVDSEQVPSEEGISPPQVVQCAILTTNRLHRSNIDFNKAMEAVADSSKIILKTRFSTYYDATMPSGMRYYVKKLNWSDKLFQLGSQGTFVREVEGLGKLNNSNVMAPLAYVLTEDSAYLFYEFPQMGTLSNAFHSSSSELDWASRYSIAVGVAQGLAFLHDCSSGPILLLDLSSKSILLKSLKEPQVGDIELCKVIDPSKSTGSLSTVAGSVGYIPPEYAYTMRITMAGNVYSFGVVLLELLTGKAAVSEGTELAKWVLVKSSQQDKWDHVLDHSISRTSPAVRSQMLAALKIALTCVSPSPEARPKMKSVLRMLLNAR
ncbi:hypothetical protein SAY87_017918 [Trapa incisa]|uniref:Protein kinase domain-containing protein n=1 Tax=Trapa incisa TaxID=236973 RepID=A0AAN7L2H0_9MYRT|nr:hypothetical protein SAY87_017918 [Trapa incisa]